MRFIHTGDIHWGMIPDADKPWGKERAQAIKDTFRSIVDYAREKEKKRHHCQGAFGRGGTFFQMLQSRARR